MGEDRDWTKRASYGHGVVGPAEQVRTPDVEARIKAASLSDPPS